ncbi:MAG: AmmeMemoRadiSam system protein A [Proteobacteria bacterium]|nr:AmmeMemoRadiSam system protein A [Pseudomonadota bacterium]
MKNSILNKKQQQELLKIARASVEGYIRSGSAAKFSISDDRLKVKEGAFVTLRKDGKLRGCIGQIIPSGKALWQVVRDMAVAAAVEDNRFLPVRAEELEELKYEISVLSAPRKINNWQGIELGKHGVIIKKGLRSGVFLPQVADETGWSKEEFLAQLCCQKAGLSADCYKNDANVELKIFTAQVFSE